MKIHLTFDIEVWCKDWNTLDEDFPHCYSRYVFGDSPKGHYALPKLLEIMNHHGLHGIFFVEALFAKRFGIEYLAQIIQIIRDAGQEVQLHVHVEWADEIHPPLFEQTPQKRQHISYYTVEEQTALIHLGRSLLEEAGSGPITAFRAGSFCTNYDTFIALQNNGIFIDSSLNACYGFNSTGLKNSRDLSTPFTIESVTTHPVSIFKDGFNRLRPAQVGSCSFNELKKAILAAKRKGHEEFVILSHNFEMLKRGSSMPDYVVVRRFQELCHFLAEHRDTLPTSGFSTKLPENDMDVDIAEVGISSSAKRVAEQIWRRFN